MLIAAALLGSGYDYDESGYGRLDIGRLLPLPMLPHCRLEGGCPPGRIGGWAMHSSDMGLPG